MKNNLTIAILLLMPFLFGLDSRAEGEDIYSVINKNLERLDLKTNDVKESDIEGLWEVITDRGLFYISKNGKFLIHGKAYKFENEIVNITEKSLASVRINGMRKFQDSMIVFPAKNEKHQITVFTDITCGYCRKLHSQIDSYNELGITVRYLAFPRSGVSGPTFSEMTAVWCAVDQQSALTQAKTGDSTPLDQTSTCNMPIADQYALGLQVGVSGTPAIMTDDGSMIPGYQPPAQLFTLLESK